ncbi:MAG: methyltransferase domain-containing protein [Bacteroidota bacterium]|nr:methyltransferase domain-containing protein [Bacteroidota bacterium]
MAEREWYKEWFNSPFYHKLYFERDETEAEDFITNLLNYLNPQPSCRFLDVACGKGRHSKFLASKGYDVNGIDISIDSINYAKKFETDNLHFYVHDMRLLFWVNYFDYALNLFTSFGYFASRRENEDALRTIAASLKPSGILLLDYLNVHYVEDRLVHNEEKRIDDTLYEIHRWHDESHFFKKIIVTDPLLDQPQEYIEKVAKFSIGDFTEMLAFQNIQVKEVFGNYKFQSYDLKTSPRLVIVAQKTNPYN